MAATQIMLQVYCCQRYDICGSCYQTVSIPKDSSYAKRLDTAVRSGIKGVTVFKLTVLLMFSKSPMIMCYNNQKPFFMGLSGRGLNAELIERVFATLTLQSSSTTRCAIGTSPVFLQKLKVVFLIFWIDFF